MAYQCNNCGPGCGSSGGSYSPHDYKGNGPAVESFGYHGNGSHKDLYENGDYHNKDGNISESYNSLKKEEEKKKDDSEKHSIEENIKKAGTEKKKDDTGEVKGASQSIHEEILFKQNKTHNVEFFSQEKKGIKKLNSIEEAIKAAIKNDGVN